MVLRRLEDGADGLAVIVSFADIYRTFVFVAAVWFLGVASKRLGMPSLVGEIACGFLLGPPLADFVPYPHAMTVIGSLGLIGLILESGICLDVAQLKEVGNRAILMGLVGSTLPLVCGYAVGSWKGLPTESAIAVGAAFAPSSLGIAASALSAGDVLNTPIGQTIVATSVVDDVLGLILLSVLHVFVQVDPAAIDFVIPFLSSFGYLALLGSVGVTWLPRLIEKKFLPLFAERRQPIAAFALMFGLLLAYMPLLNYSRASYLTGVFLAGVSFSKIHTVRSIFTDKGRPVLNWLLRIFYAATIGFQVPITRFSDPYVLKWGGILLIPVLAKIPLGMFVPKFQRLVADDFPYSPYRRDVATTSLAMVCRGEFNYIIAAFALGEGLFDPRVYTACVFALLLASIVTPLVLQCMLGYYNGLSRTYLDGDHPIQRIGNTCDGYRPLFVAIQARTPVRWGLQETIQRTLEEDGLILIDHRSWHTNEGDDDMIDVTEVFAQDTRVKIRVAHCFDGTTRDATVDVDDVDGKDENETTDDRESTSDGGLDDDVETAHLVEVSRVKDRCDEIQSILTDVLHGKNDGDFVIQVSQWEAFAFEASSVRSRPGYYTFHTNAPAAAPPRRRTVSWSSFRRPRLESSEEDPHLSTADLWETDEACLQDDEVIREHLHGYVRPHHEHPHHH